ncbi:MAG: hypothetical protein IPG92_18950 [Flavobacteriales bacterium]|nr:hypothetical protein [Flavobacteriales bacterium]
MEITYVELLPYANARVELFAGTNYTLVSTSPLAHLRIDATVRSQRTITGIDLMGTGVWAPGTPSTFVAADSAALHLSASNVPANHPFSIGYEWTRSATGSSA